MAAGRARGRGVATIVLAGTAVLASAGCTGGGGSTPDGSTSGLVSPSGSATPSGTPTPSTFPDLVATPGAPVGSAAGRITGLSPDVEVTVGVLSVTALERSTTLAYQLTAAGDTVTGGEYLLDSPRNGIQLVAKQAGQRFFVEFFTRGSFAHCVCSERPTGLGTAPVFQYAAYPPLPASVTEVEVQVPGLKPVTVPVTRR